MRLYEKAQIQWLKSLIRNWEVMFSLGAKLSGLFISSVLFCTVADTSNRNKGVHTPNNVAAVSSTAFYVTNDHSKPTGFVRRNVHPMLFPTSDVQYCETKEKHCYPAAAGLNYPNGVTKYAFHLFGLAGILTQTCRGPGRVFYVSSSAKGVIYVMFAEPDNRFSLLETINVGKILDNLHVTEEGHIYA